MSARLTNSPVRLDRLPGWWPPCRRLRPVLPRMCLHLGPAQTSANLSHSPPASGSQQEQFCKRLFGHPWRAASVHAIEGIFGLSGQSPCPAGIEHVALLEHQDDTPRQEEPLSSRRRYWYRWGYLPISGWKSRFALNFPRSLPITKGVHISRGARDLMVSGEQGTIVCQKWWVGSRVDFSRTFLTAHDLLTHGPICDRN